MAERTPQGKGRSPSRFASDYFDAERLKKREGIERKLQEFAARRPWLLRQEQETSQTSDSSSSSPEATTGAPPGSEVNSTLERLHGRIEAADRKRRAMSHDEPEFLRREIEAMGKELDSLD